MESRADPRNCEFLWTSPVGPRAVLDDEQARQWNESGYFVLRDAFTADEVASLTAEIDSIQVQVSAFLGTRPGGKACIVQLAPDAAVAFRNGDVPEPQDDPDRQFPILERGRPVAASG
jgi:hypothetical protein